VLQKSNASGKLRSSTPTAAGALWIPGQAQHVYFILPWIYLLTYTSNQNEKIMRVFAVLILVSSLTYSVVYLLARIQML
jgi:hypothetical protein